MPLPKPGRPSSHDKAAPVASPARTAPRGVEPGRLVVALLLGLLLALFAVAAQAQEYPDRLKFHCTSHEGGQFELFIDLRARTLQLPGGPTIPVSTMTDHYVSTSEVRSQAGKLPSVAAVTLDRRSGAFWFVGLAQVDPPSSEGQSAYRPTVEEASCRPLGIL
jgi:hypothetical protein